MHSNNVITTEKGTNNEIFAVRMADRSMLDNTLRNVNPHNVVFLFKKQNYAQNGDVVIFINNGVQAVRRYKTMGDVTLLVPDNTDFDTQVAGEDFIVLGKAIECRISLGSDE